MHDSTPRSRRRYCPASITVASISAAVMLAGVIADSFRMYGSGLIGLMLAATVLVTLRTGVNTEVLEYARQAGYDAGYQDALMVEPVQVIGLHVVPSLPEVALAVLP